MRKPSPWLRSLYRSSAEAGRNWGEGVSQWTGKTGRLPRGERAGCGGDSEVAAEERGGRGGANSLRKGAGRALPPHACAPRSSCPLAPEVRCHSAPSTDGAHVGEEEPPRPPRDTRPPEACGGPLEGTRGHLFLLWGGVREPRTGTPVVYLPSPTKSGAGGPGRATEESAPGFPAHFNSVSAWSARRFTPPGAPEPSAGTRCATPSHPPGTESGLSDLSALKSPRPGLHSLSLRGSDPGRPWRLESGPLTRERGGTT